MNNKNLHRKLNKALKNLKEKDISPPRILPAATRTGGLGSIMIKEKGPHLLFEGCFEPSTELNGSTFQYGIKRETKSDRSLKLLLWRF